ncbi:MAG: MFS transporter [Acetanaerobacterium sp.]
MQNIILLGLVSFFSDISTEMVYPIIPLYLTSVFGATPVLVGIIEGIAESLASLLKVFSGYITDKAQKKKPLAFIGYAAGLAYKMALLVAGSWMGILGARVIDRIGKGIRTSPRDVMVSESADKDHMGKAFGIHKAMDMAGSAIGILIAYLLMKSVNGTFQYKKLFLISTIPAIVGLLLIPAIREKREHRAAKAREPFWKNIKNLDGQLKLYLLVAFVFTLGNSSNTFLLLRAKDMGFDNTTVILLYLLYSITASILAMPLGKLSDKIGRKKLLVCGYIIFAVVYICFALAINKVFIIAAFVFYGAYTAMITGVERAFIAEISPKELKGTMLGLHSTIVGVALLPASAIAGVLWNCFGAYVPFLFGAGMSLGAAFALCFFMHGKKPVSLKGTMNI